MFENVIVSKYPSAYSKIPEQVNLLDELKKINEGYYKSTIDACRKFVAVGDNDSYNKLKTNLPAITFSGQFDGAHRKENIVAYTQLLILDLDKLDSSIIQQKKESIFQDIHVLAVWISPSGNGLKVLISLEVTEENHKYGFDQAVEYFNSKYDVNVDRSGSDICRLCFVSFDNELLAKSNVTAFVVENVEQIVIKEKSVTAKIASDKIQVRPSEKRAFYETEGRNAAGDRATIQKITRYLRSNKKSITASYDNWYKVSLAIANTFTYDIGEKIFLDLCKLDGEKYDEYKSKNLLEYSYRNRLSNKITFGTIIYFAREQDFK